MPTGEKKCLEKLNGIFAFGIWQSEKQALFVARDRLGVKPFFYARPQGDFLFASEIKTLLAYEKMQSVVDMQGVGELLFIGPGRTPGCGVFRDVFSLKPGYCGTFDRSGFHTRPYWELKDAEHHSDLAATTETVRTLVTDAIERQLVSDVPIGFFLSGGLDSSIICAVAHGVLGKRGERIRTFSVCYEGNDKHFKPNRFQPASDQDYIRIMTQALNSIHCNVVLGIPELVKALYSAVDARDLPGMADVDASLLLFCQEIKKHVTVALSGECADEVFGGYPWYRNEKLRAAYGFPWAQSTQYRATFLHPALRNRLDAFQYTNERYEASLAQTHMLADLNPREKRMREMVHLNMYWFMQTLLDRKDRMSMYSGLEVRVPFCDHRIVQTLYSVPWEMKDCLEMEKGLLREAVKGLLPEEIRLRKKSPYPKTHHPGYMAAVSEAMAGVMQNADAPLWSIVDRAAVEKLLVSDRQEPWYGQLMTTPQTVAYLLQLNYWLEKYRVRICV